MTNSKVAYQRLNIQRLPERPFILKLVVPMVIVFFIIFCFIGFLIPQPGSTVNRYDQNWSSESFINDSELLDALKSLLHCKSTGAEYRIETRGNFYVLKNFITPKRKRQLECYESITYTTHGDYRFLDNIIPLLERWQAPLSVAVYAPGEELDVAVEALRYLMYCERQSYLVEEYASVHLYFDFERIPPKPIEFYRDLIQRPAKCPTNHSFPMATVDSPSNHTYPVNVGRNIARDAAQTHFVLASDIELYPNPGFIEMFLQMIVHPAYRHTLDVPSVYVLPVFEVSGSSSVPEDKIELLQMLKRGDAIKFHENICPQCHTVPNYDEWLAIAKTEQSMDILSTAKREGRFDLWEPIYVGTKMEPQYQERLNWEGKFDKMTQGYIMCVLGYSFHVLDNGFLVHRPGFKNLTEAARPDLERTQRNFVEDVIFEELKVLYGEDKHCRL
ncbi:beta-1,4-glucuronyltransferase 1-like [Ochlerotatus camptorhynchus]|uniref:beta-1,4-glucuronyltransferase 1-like n=1 Tax=Ochlerotatus camptorhynchus TaxID=644619 RepID=UPI0031DC5AA0